MLKLPRREGERTDKRQMRRLCCAPVGAVAATDSSAAHGEVVVPLLRLLPHLLHFFLVADIVAVLGPNPARSGAARSTPV